MKKKKLPTKEEIKAARDLRKQGRALMAQANKVLDKLRRPIRAHRRRTEMDRATIDYRNWRHDMQVLMPAILRLPGADDWTPEQLVARTALAADQMKHEIATRRPKGMKEFGLRRSPSVWLDWQDFFDVCVHHLAERSQLHAATVIERSAALADAAMKVIKKRRAALEK